MIFIPQRPLVPQDEELQPVFFKESGTQPGCRVTKFEGMIK